MKNNTEIMKKSIFLAILFLAILLIPLPVESAETIIIEKYSVSYDFFLGAVQPSPSICLCDTKADEIIIRNTGTFRAEYDITTNIPEHAHVAITTISLEPGEERTIPVTLSASCTDRERTTTYDVYVTNNFGTEKVIRRDISFERCQTINASLFADRDTILPCEPVNYTLELVNPAPFQEEYIIMPATNEEFFSEEAYSLVLPPGRTGVVNTEFLPACDVYGEITNEFLIRSLNNNLESTISHELEIEQAYDFEAIIPEEASFCEEASTQRIPIEITNEARMTNEFILDLTDAPGFISVPDNTIELDPTQQGTLYIEGNLLPSHKGIYEFQARIRTGIGDMETTRNITLSVETCHNPIITLDVPDKDCTGITEYQARVLNNGTRATNFSVNTFPEETASIDTTSIYLEPGQEETINITANFPDDERQTRYETIGLTVVHPDLDIGWTEEKTFEVYNQYACTKPAVSPTRITARHGDENVTITITNEGVKTTDYNLMITGTTFVALETNEVTLEPSESRDLLLLLYQDDSNITTHDFTLSLESHTNILYEEAFTLRLTDLLWYEQILPYIYLLLLLILLILIILALIKVFKKKKTKEKPKKKVVVKKKAVKKKVVKKKAEKPIRPKRYRGPVTGYRLVLLILILLVALATPVIFGVPEPLQPVIPRDVRDDPMHIAWPENETYYVDLKDYFYDPDTDPLVFMVGSSPMNIMAEIQDNLLVLTPQESWTGKGNITLIASDQRGGITESPPILLEVVKVPVYTEEELFAFYAPYIYALIIILVLLIIFLLPLRKKPLPAKKKSVKKKVTKKKKAARKRKK